MAAVEELRAAQAAEAALRTAAEASLHEAAAAFKAQLFDKTEALASLRVQLRQLQAWQRRALASRDPSPSASGRGPLRQHPPLLAGAAQSRWPSPSPSCSPSPPHARPTLSLRKSAGALLDEGAHARLAPHSATQSPGRPARGQGASASDALARSRGVASAAPAAEAAAVAGMRGGLDGDAQEVEAFWREQELQVSAAKIPTVRPNLEIT